MSYYYYKCQLFCPATLSIHFVSTYTSECRSVVCVSQDINCYDLIFGGTWIDGMENHIKYVELVYTIGRYDDNIRHQEGPKSFRERKKKKILNGLNSEFYSGFILGIED